MSDSKRILFFENNAAYFLSHRLPLARAVQEQGHEVHVATIPDAAAKNIPTAGFEFHPLPFSRGGVNPLHEWESYRRIRRLYLEVRPSLVYQVTVKPVIYGSHAARHVHIPAVISVISGLGYFAAQSGLRGRVFRELGLGLYRSALRHPNQKVIFHNSDNRDTFVAKRVLKSEDSEVLPGSGVDLDYFLMTPEPQGAPQIVLPARMLREKGVYEFVAAATLLRAEGIKARFVLVGDTDRGNPSAIPEAQLRRWRVEGNVEWMGHVSNMRALYASSHIVCLPSYHEGLPKVLLEAAACGRPVVTTDVPGCRDAVLAGEAGLLVPRKDAAKLADALRSLIQNSELRQRMGSRARRIAESRFSTNEVIARTIEIMQKLLAASG